MHRSPRGSRAPRSRSLWNLPVLSAGLVAVAIACATGCGLVPTSSFVPDQAPTVTLTSGPVDTVSSPLSWIVTIAWRGTDPDGRIDHYEYATDPPRLRDVRLAAAETSWVRTTATSVTVHFRASHPDSLGPGATASDFHVFVLRAFDNRGVPSPRVVRAFYAYTVAPDVQIDRPRPSQLLRAIVPLPFRVEWEGRDPDGAGSQRPAFYRVLTLSLEDPSALAFLVDPDSLRRVAIATNWAGWQTLGADTTSLAITNAAGFAPGQSGLVAVVAVDEAGASTPYFDLNRNLLQFTAVATDAEGPLIHISSPLVDFTFATGGYENDPRRTIAVEVATGQRFTIHWDGIAAPGRQVSVSRWMLDGDIADETPRSDENTDLVHWSRLGPAAAGATIGPLPPGVHFLYVELRDDLGGRSLAIVEFHVIQPDLSHDLLVVDDTRLEVDKITGTGCAAAYTRLWPSAAELDTLLYARGNVPWRCAQNPAGALSPPGLLAGYSFDTLGTRLGLDDPAQAVPLATLARYRHVLWIVDQLSAGFAPYNDQNLFPTTALRAMSAPGRASTLAAYIQLGGKVWLAGGGAAFASLADFDRVPNNTRDAFVFTARAGELGPGRPIYDAVHIRSALALTDLGTPPARSPAAVGGWSGEGPDGQLAAPDYARAPATLHGRAPDTDPIPPTRSPSRPDLFYFHGGLPRYGEFVVEPDSIVEDVSHDPAVVHLASVLDTVYEASPEPGAATMPLMLYYHGRENAPIVFTGFDLWSWTRADAQALVDFVLNDVWGLARIAPGAARAPAGLSSGAARQPVRAAARVRRLDPR